MSFAGRFSEDRQESLPHEMLKVLLTVVVLVVSFAASLARYAPDVTELDELIQQVHKIDEVLADPSYDVDRKEMGEG